jgi:hypothetical protein
LALGLLGFESELESCAADHRQNQHFRREQNKALRSEIIDQNRNSRFNNNHTAMIFGSFDQAKEQHQPLFY